MKLSVLIPSDEYRSYAGARFRYGRLRPMLARLGAELTLENLDAFDPRRADCDVLLVSKCHDGASLVAAAAASMQGQVVGIDLFDDYYSQVEDSRLAAYRAWVGQLVSLCDFALCSTEAMVDMVSAYRADLPTHVLNDPAPLHDIEAVGGLADRKLADAVDSQCLGVAWFGVGDNPYFAVGLADLAAFGAQIADLGRDGMTVQLTVLTNKRALGADGLSLIAGLPVRAQVREWSEEAEREVLGEALVAFLPVNAQPFSAAKSLNRAITALSHGCQVLSAGYPLYSALDPLIYRDPSAFLGDLADNNLRLSPATIETYREKLREFASAEIEAERLLSFLSMVRSPGRPQRPISVIHGVSTRGDAHRLVKAVDGFSVASPFCAAPFAFDVIFQGSPDALDMLVSRTAAKRLRREAQSRLMRGDRVRGQQYLTLRAPGERRRGAQERPSPTPTIVQLATYASVMSEIDRKMHDAFGPCRTIVSENTALPFQLPTATA